MSFLPKRVKDLPPLEPDSEDEFKTPQKTKNENKENLGLSRGDAFLSREPKRVSELPPLESDSDDDECKNDSPRGPTIKHRRPLRSRLPKNSALSTPWQRLQLAELQRQRMLNCAILNDSFIMSPARSDVDDTSPRKDQKPSKVIQSTADDSLHLHFDKMKLIENISMTAKESPPQLCIVQQKVPPPLKQIQENQVSVSDSHPGSTQTSAATLEASQEAQFATPQIRSWSIARRPRDLCSTQLQKTRSAIVNEFRSQKVLFQTPMAVSRAPIACMTNDSITLSLCDTINESGTPGTAEKPPQPQSPMKSNADVKSKKCLGDAFDGQEAESMPKSKENIVMINGSEYVIQKKLGCGGSSSVYLANRKDSGKDCALKIVDLRGDSAVVEGYLNETKLLAKLQGNICVVSLYEYELLAKESKLFMVMEKGDSDLHKILQTYKTNLPLYVLMNFWYQMLQSVNYIHQNGVIHSDLKPANFLMVHGRLKLIDFGIASNIAIDSTSIIKFSQAGTFNYISPEALIDTSTGNSPMGKNQPKIKISTKSDVWSLGCILYLLLYQKTPFGHIKNIYAKVNAITSPSTDIQYPAIPSFYPIMLVQMAKKCLQHNPKQRPSVAELLQYPFNMVIPIQNLSLATK